MSIHVIHFYSQAFSPNYARRSSFHHFPFVRRCGLQVEIVPSVPTDELRKRCCVVLALYWNRKWCGSISSRTKIFTLIFTLNLKTKKHWKKMKEIRLMNKEVKTVWSSVTFATRVVFWCLIPSYLVSSPSRLRISKSNKGKKTTQNIVLCNCFQ